MTKYVRLESDCGFVFVSEVLKAQKCALSVKGYIASLRLGKTIWCSPEFLPFDVRLQLIYV